METTKEQRAAIAEAVSFAPKGILRCNGILVLGGKEFEYCVCRAMTNEYASLIVLACNSAPALVRDVEALVAENARVVADNAAMVKRHAEICGALYGHNLNISGWHANGDLQAMDTWFEENGWLDDPTRPRPGNALLSRNAELEEAATTLHGELRAASERIRELETGMAEAERMQDLRIKERDEYLVQLRATREVLEAAKCPNSCLNGIVRSLGVDNEERIEQCQWCDMRETALARPAKEGE